MKCMKQEICNSKFPLNHQGVKALFSQARRDSAGMCSLSLRLTRYQLVTYLLLTLPTTIRNILTPGTDHETSFSIYFTVIGSTIGIFTPIALDLLFNFCMQKFEIGILRREVHGFFHNHQRLLVLSLMLQAHC